MDHNTHQWAPLPPNHHIQTNNSPSSYPHTSLQTLQDQFSHISLSGSDVAFPFPNLPSLNLNLNHQYEPNLSAWELDKLRTYFNAKLHEHTNYPGSSSYPSYPNLINIPENLGLRFASPFTRDYSSINSRHISRSSVTNDNDLRRRVHEFSYANNNSHYHNDYNQSAWISFLYKYLHDNRNYHVNYNYNYNNYIPLRRTPSTRNNRLSYNNNEDNGAIPVSLVHFPSTWEEIKGKVIYFANEKSLSQFLIKKFELGQMEGIKMVVSELKEGGVTHILFNQVGNQFFQRLLDFLDHQYILELIKGVMANQQQFVDICLDDQGTRAAQKLLKFMDKNSLEEKAILLNAIRGVIVTLTKNMNGYHFIEELLKNFRGVCEVIEPLLSEVADHCVDIAMDKSGCCVMQYCIQHGQGQYRDHIIHEIINHALELSENDYGNYVVQFVIGMKNDPHITAQAIRGLKGNFVSLSMNKFGSHVVEKCLKEADDDSVNKIICEFIEDSNSFLDILQHPVGNFVAQTALHRSKEMQTCNRPSMYPILVERIMANYVFLHSHMHGKRVLSHVKYDKFRVLI